MVFGVTFSSLLLDYHTDLNTKLQFTGTPSPTKYPCPPGTFTNSSSLFMETQCTDCYQKYYCPGGEAEPRGLCPPGYYCPTKTRFATEFPCPNRTYNPDYALFQQSQCKVCTQGHFCEKGTVTPYECPIGRSMNFISTFDFLRSVESWIQCQFQFHSFINYILKTI